MTTELAEVLDAIVLHVSSGGTLQASSALVPLAQQALARVGQSSALALVEPGARLPVRPGLTDEEKRIRRASLGSSEIAAICGVNPYASCHNVWLSKCRNVDFEGNEATMLGNLLEPAIFAIYADRYKRRLRKGVYTLGPEPWMSATPDAHIMEEGGGLVEAKLVGLRSIWMWGTGNTDQQESDSIPLHYLTQAHWQMIVTGEPFVDVSALMGTEFRSYTVRTDPELQAKLVQRGEVFWKKYVLTGEPPPVDGSDGASSMLRALYPKSGPPAVAADKEIEDLAEHLLAAREAVTAAETEKKRLENVIKARLGDASGAFGDGWRLRYSTTKAGSRPFVFQHEKEKQT